MSNPFDKIDKHVVEGNAKNALETRSTYNHGTNGTPPLFMRFVVLETVFDPTTVDEKKADYYQHVLGVKNFNYAKILPRNAIVARRVADANTSASEQAMFLFPFFPPTISFPVQPGEHVWAIFEHPGVKQTDLGYWMCRIVEPGFVEDVNHTHAPRAIEPSFNPGTKDIAEGKDTAVYEFRNGQVGIKNGERYSLAETLQIHDGEEDAYEKLMTETEGGKLMTYEAVPRYRKRPGELTFEGTNNTLIVLGRDRTGAVATYKKDPKKGDKFVDELPEDDAKIDAKGAGSIDLVVGRGQTETTSGKIAKSKTIKKGDFKEELDKSKKELVEKEGDPDFKNDRSRILIAQKTKPDKNFKLEKAVSKHASKSPVKDASKGGGAIVIKSDKIRLIARQDVVILVSGAEDGDKDDNGNIKDPDADPGKSASIIIRANGDIIFTPATKGIVKLGGDDADKAVLCFKEGAANAGGTVAAPPVMSTMGGFLGLGGAHGVFASKIMAK
jgi:hypothetical protein